MLRLKNNLSQVGYEAALKECKNFCHKLFRRGVLLIEKDKFLRARRISNMSWLYTIVFAGLMLSSDGGNLPAPASNNYTDAKTITVTLADETEKFEQTYPLNANGRVSVSNVNGSIVVEVWDKNEVKLEYVKTADDREALADIIVRINAQPDYLSVETDFDKLYRNLRNNGGQRKNYRRSDVEYRLTVPRNAL